MLTLNCTADGSPEPNITWTRLSNGETVNMPLTVTGKKYEEVYRCTASNEIGTVFNDTSVTRMYHVIEWYLSEDMILALAGQFKQLSHEPEKFR